MRVSVLPGVAACSFFLLMLSACERSPSPSQPPFGMVEFPDNASHIDRGFAESPDQFPFFPSRASSGGRKISPDMFDPPEVCGGCHTEIYQQWKGSMHSNSWKDPIYRAALDHFSKATGGKMDNFCMGCHTPIGVLAGEANSEGTAMSAIADRGVQCDVCHNISGSTGIGNGSFVLTPKMNGRPLKFGPFKDSESPYHDTAYSALHTRSEFCGQCHNVTHPFNRMPIERTYDEWRDSVYAGQGVQCQDCHMMPRPGMTENPGRATPFSKERKRIYTHYFVGGNVVVPALLGSPKHAELAREMLRSAATVEIVAPERLRAGAVETILVRVTNSGAGHKLPTGFPEGREMWVDLRVVDAAGKTIYRRGAVRDGALEANARPFKVVLGDRHGNVVELDLQDADRILSDTRIPPKATSELDYDVPIPTNARGPLTLRADVNYWSISPALVKRLMGDKAPAIPVVEMARASRTVTLQRAQEHVAATKPERTLTK